MADFFISYTSADKAWAEWIAWQLEEAGYTTNIQAWDFRPGTNFVQSMQQATAEDARTIAVLSPDYLTSRFTQPEWEAAFAQDPTGEKGLLLPVRVRECDARGLLPQLVYIDLVGVDEDRAAEVLLAGVKQTRAKPSTSPKFPGSTPQEKPPGPRFPSGLPPIWNVPHNRNPNFTGRETLLSEIEANISTSDQTVLNQTIGGLGGIGKTQVAVEYAYRHAAEYATVWWVNAEAPAVLASDYARLAHALQLPVAEGTDQGVTVQAVRQWLNQNGQWLLIFDNANSPDEVHDFLPQGQTGHVLITSRNQDWHDTAQVLPISTWPPEESIAFLNKRLSQTDEAAARTLAEELGHLPLALAQAAAYITKTGILIARYLALYRERREALWAHEAPPTDYEKTVGTTGSMAMTQVQEAAPGSGPLLSLCAYMGAQEMPLSVIREGAEHLPDTLAVLVTDELALNDALSALRSYSLLDVADETLSIHRLVQAVVRDRQSEADRLRWATAAVHLLADAFPFKAEDLETWALSALLLPHALAALDQAATQDIADAETAVLLNRLSLFLSNRAEYTEAEPLMERALRIVEAVHGPEYLLVAMHLNNLAQLYQAKGQYREAEPLMERALRIAEAVHGPEHPDVATALNNLAGLYKAKGQYAEAEPLMERALGILEVKLGATHPNVAIALNNYAACLDSLGRDEEAEQCRARAAAIRVGQGDSK